MSHLFNWLQFFADGGAPAGGDGADSGVDSGNPGQSLEDLGVPADKAERFRQRKKSKPSQVEASEAPQPAPEKPTMSWDDFMAIPENNERMQRTMSDRVKNVARESNEYMSKLNPALELIASRYGLSAGEDGRFDPQALADAIQNDDSYYEKQAADMGVDVEVAKHIAQLEAEKKRNDEVNQKAERDRVLREHFMGLQQQANDLQQVFPGFDLQQELNNPDFFRFTSPEVGMSVEQAFYALHGKQIQDKAVNAMAQKAKVDAANAIRSGVRPRENGTSATAPVSATPNLKQMKREDRIAYIKAKYGPPG